MALWGGGRGHGRHGKGIQWGPETWRQRGEEIHMGEGRPLLVTHDKVVIFQRLWTSSMSKDIISLAHKSTIHNTSSGLRGFHFSANVLISRETLKF